MLMRPLRKNEPKIHDARSAGASPPRVPTASMIATGPVAAKDERDDAVDCLLAAEVGERLPENGVRPLFLLALEDRGDPCPPPMHIVTSA
jgi:hypothetical protein